MEALSLPRPRVSSQGRGNDFSGKAEDFLGKAEEKIGKGKEKIGRAEDFFSLFFLPPCMEEEFLGLENHFSGRENLSSDHWKESFGRFLLR